MIDDEVIFEFALRKESVDRNSSGAKADSATQWSLSARRAWIEILNSIRRLVMSVVALRKESVDRNEEVIAIKEYSSWSLSARRAWIEMISELHPLMASVVALRKESVDRNLYTLTRCASHRVALRKESVDRNDKFHVAVHFDTRRSPQGERG